MLSETKSDSTFPSTQFLINCFSVPPRLDQNSKCSGILLNVKDEISFTNEQILSSTAYWDLIFRTKSKEPKKDCMLFPQKLSQWAFTSTYRRHSVLF